MYEYGPGIFIFILALLIYVYAFIIDKREKHSAAIWLLVAGGLVLRAYCSADMYLHEWDERYHALVAKNLTAHWLKPTLYDNPVLPFEMTNWGSNHIWLHKQPVPLWLMAISIKLFGTTEIAVRIPSIVLSLITIKLVYDLSLYIFNRRVAFMSAFLCSINGVIIELVAGRIATDHIDAIFLFFTTLAFWWMVKYLQLMNNRALLMAGIALGCAILTKWLPALFCLPAWWILARGQGNMLSYRTIFSSTLLVLSVALAIVLPWHLYINLAFPLESAAEYQHISRHFTEQLDGHNTNLFFHFNELRMSYGELVYLPIIWFTWQALSTKEAKYLAPVVFFWIVYLFFSLAATRMKAYTIIAAPAIFMMTAYCYYALSERISGSKYRLAMALGTFLLIALPARYTIERVSFFHPEEREPTWAKEIKSWDYAPNTVVVNCKHPIEAMFYHNIPVYEQVPDSNTINTLTKRGYKIVFDD